MKAKAPLPHPTPAPHHPPPHPLHPLPWCLYESCKTLARERSFFFPQSHAQSEKNNLSRLLSVSGHLTTKPSRPPTKSPRSIEFSLALFWIFMNGNFLTVTLFSYFKEMSTSGCETFLPVFQSLKCQSLHSQNLLTWDQALFSFRFENYIPGGKAKRRGTR